MSSFSFFKQCPLTAIAPFLITFCIRALTCPLCERVHAAHPWEAFLHPHLGVKTLFRPVKVLILMRGVELSDGTNLQGSMKTDAFSTASLILLALVLMRFRSYRRALKPSWSQPTHSLVNEIGPLRWNGFIFHRLTERCSTRLVVQNLSPYCVLFLFFSSLNGNFRKRACDYNLHIYKYIPFTSVLFCFSSRVR